MKQKLKKDYYKRLNYRKFEIKRLQYLAIKNNSILPLSIRQKAEEELVKLNGEKTKIRNRCIQTGRSRAIIKEFKISRIQFKLLADQGLIPGVRRASW